MQTNKIKVLFIADSLGPGGAERRLVQLLKGLADKKFATKIILLTDIVHYREVYDLKMEVIKMDRKIKKDPTIFARLYRLCRRWRPDIIHAWGSMPAVYAGPVAKLLGIKLINAMIADAPLRLSAQKRIRSFFTFPFSDIIQSNSRAGLEVYNVPKSKRNVIHNGFDFSRMERLRDAREVRDELGIETRYVAGMVAGFKYQKDHETLIRAANEIIRRREDISFVCVGGGTGLDRIESMAESTERIIFTGERNDVESIVQIFDIGILSTYSEGISNSIMEYMAAGKAVIATEGGGTSELVVDGETGFLIPLKSPDKLVESINRLLDDDSLRKRMGEEGRRRIREEFSIETMVEGHIDTYERLLRGNRSSD